MDINNLAQLHVSEVYVMGVCLLEVVEEGCFALDALAFTSRVMGAAGERAFSNFENGTFVR